MPNVSARAGECISATTGKTCETGHFALKAGAETLSQEVPAGRQPVCSQKLLWSMQTFLALIYSDTQRYEHIRLICDYAARNMSPFTLVNISLEQISFFSNKTDLGYLNDGRQMSDRTMSVQEKVKRKKLLMSRKVHSLRGQKEGNGEGTIFGKR